MKVLLINGSPNRNGCTNRALEEVEKTLHEEGIDTEIFQIGNGQVHGCNGCNACEKTGKCIHEDDPANTMNPSYELLYTLCNLRKELVVFHHCFVDLCLIAVIFVIQTPDKIHDAVNKLSASDFNTRKRPVMKLFEISAISESFNEKKNVLDLVPVMIRRNSTMRIITFGKFLVLTVGETVDLPFHGVQDII